MASLISYKQIAAHRPDQRKRYLISFTLCNVLLLVILLPLGLFGVGASGLAQHWLYCRQPGGAAV